MEIVVLHTTIAETLQALKTAAQLASGLSARIRLLVLEVVPYPLPLDRPHVPLAFTRRRFRTLAANSSIETNIDIHLVRDPDQTIESILEPHSVVVMGAHRSWWPSAHSRVATRLERLGHQVVFAG
jgi:membrane-associated phospholipid phosphatase